jgi:aminoglycoside/choline kinase family phosphotransferase
MSNRVQLRAAFARANTCASAILTALPVDASFRSYYRVTTGDDSMMLMDAPPDKEDVAPFVAIARHLQSLGLSAPQIFAMDEANGLLLLEDFGNATFTHLLRAAQDSKDQVGDSTKATEAALYERAIDVLVHLHTHAATTQIDVPPYDIDALLREVSLFADWYLPALTGESCAVVVREQWLEAWRTVFDELAPMEPTLVLRDFHVDNLMLLKDRVGVRGCGLLDFQDALIGSPAYDLVSLVEDARRDISPELATSLIARYQAARPDVDSNQLAAWCASLGAQRHAKVAGIFVRLCDRDGKSHYLAHVPRVMRLFKRALHHEALEPVRNWCEAHLAAPASELLIHR